jgi:hypothetical protein
MKYIMKLQKSKKGEGTLDFIQENIFILISAAVLTVFLFFFLKGCQPLASDEACYEQLRVQKYFTSSIKETEIFEKIPPSCMPKEPEIITTKDQVKAEFEVIKLMQRCWEKYGGPEGYRLPRTTLPKVVCAPCFVFQAKNIKQPIRKETILSDMGSTYLSDGKTLEQYLNGYKAFFASEQELPLTPDILPGRYYTVMIGDDQNGLLIDRTIDFGNWVSDSLDNDEPLVDDELRGKMFVYIEEQNKANKCAGPSWFPQERLTS